MPIYRAWLVLKKGFERVIANIYCNHGWEFLIDVIKNYVDLGSLSLENQTSWSSRSAPPKVTGLNVELNLGLPKQTSKLGFTLFLRIRALGWDGFSRGHLNAYGKWTSTPHTSMHFDV